MPCDGNGNGATAMWMVLVDGELEVPLPLVRLHSRVDTDKVKYANESFEGYGLAIANTNDGAPGSGLNLRGSEASDLHCT